ncbi:MAG TPA: DUF2206 domain-containing protein, partial [Clostridia bacterium]|nr:DUF2206 domain-containing protein [Clostridia bacterium]
MKIISPVRIIDWPIKRFLIIIISLQLFVLGAIGLDYTRLNIPIVRSISCFVYLTFVPGTLVMRLLKIHKLDTIESLVYTVGLSISILMFVGFIINYLYPIIGISKPMAIAPLVFSITALVLALCVLCYIKDNSFSDIEYFESKNLFSVPSLFICLLPLLSILGTYYVNFYQNNLFLMVLIILISFIVLLIGWSNTISEKLYPFVIFSISLSLLFHRSMISMYINGWDINLEYYFVNLVKMNSSWNSSIYGDCNAMLSLVMLAPIYSTFMNIGFTWVFKIVYIVLYSFFPICLYGIFKKQSNEKIGFFACFFLMCIFSFYSEMTSLMRQEIAEFFLMLVALLMINNKAVSAVNKTILIVIFSVSLVVSHYSSSYLYMCSLISVYFIQLFFNNQNIRKSLSRIITFENFHPIGKKDLSNPFDTSEINLNYIILFFVTAALWYIYNSSSSPFISLVLLVNHIVNSFFSAFLDPTAVQSLQILNNASPSISHKIVKYLHLTTLAFIAIGILTGFSKNNYFSRNNFKLEPQYFAFSLAFFAVVIVGFVVPYFASALNTTRLYHFCLMFLALFGIIGGKVFFDFILTKFNILNSRKINSYRLLSVFFIIFFLLNTGWIYEITNDYSTSISLSQKWIKESGDEQVKAGYYTTVIPEQDVYSATWLHNYIINNYNSSVYNNSDSDTRYLIYSDLTSSANVLASYGMFGRSNLLLNDHMYGFNKHSYIYLSYCDIVENFGTGPYD